MKHVAMGIVLAAIGLVLVNSGPSDARADQSGDPGFCLTGWAFEPDGTEFIVGGWQSPGLPRTFVVIAGGEWVCNSD